jgi:hypothetical protein
MDIEILLLLLFIDCWWKSKGRTKIQAIVLLDVMMDLMNGKLPMGLMLLLKYYCIMNG